MFEERFLKESAERDDVSPSMKGRDLIREVLEIHEDIYWNREGTARRQCWKFSM
ncbi:MAG: hypothetical protein HYV02_00440 [Deltaproteobacteria bacterium]|nr:hypothetical protein [Deltaproteobacteria bacterium]